MNEKDVKREGGKKLTLRIDVLYVFFCFLEKKKKRSKVYWQSTPKENAVGSRRKG